MGPDTEEPEPEANVVRLRNDGTFGNMLTDSEGMSLYFFSPDVKGDSNCTDGCLNNWPVFYEVDITLDEGLDADDFGSITRSDGDMQTTYKGWPLYYYANDSAEGDVNGDGVGSVWFVAKPDYSVMMARAQLVGRDRDGVETNLTGDYEAGDGDTFYMTDALGNTLYAFINDTNGVNNFTNEDFSNDAVWPIFEVELEAVPSVLDAAHFGSIDVFGRQQLTYRGWPLYYFGQDEARGDNYGVGFPAPGVWPIVNPETETAPQPKNESVVYSVTNDGAISYIFNGDGLTDAVNPDLTLTRGQTYEFNVNAPGHPFLIKSVQSIGTDDTYGDGVDNNGASDGKLTFTVPIDAPDTLYYVCEFHSPMTGTLNITD
jgi:predicted lipoprotein with Yx(FWY)xxD motif